jgi:hypothetical protein
MPGVELKAFRKFLGFAAYVSRNNSPGLAQTISFIRELGASQILVLPHFSSALSIRMSRLLGVRWVCVMVFHGFDWIDRGCRDSEIHADEYGRKNSKSRVVANANLQTSRRGLHFAQFKSQRSSITLLIWTNLAIPVGAAVLEFLYKKNEQRRCFQPSNPPRCAVSKNIVC